MQLILVVGIELRMNLTFGGPLPALFGPPTFASQGIGTSTAEIFLPRRRTLELDYLLEIPAQERAGPFSFGSRLRVDGAGNAHTMLISFLGGDDRYRLEFRPIHGKKRFECRAYCPDGTSNQPCVKCEFPGITVRICC